MATSYPNAALPTIWGLDWRNDKMSSSIIECDNVIFNSDNSVSRLNGFRTTLNSAVTPDTFTTNLFYWNRELTSGDMLVAAIAGNLYTTNDGLTAMTMIDSGFASGAYIGIASYGDLIHYGDGLNANRTFDGTDSYVMSIVEPATAPTAADGGAGSLGDGGTYVYAFTYYNSTLGKESGISLTKTHTLAAGQTAVNLSDIAVSSDTQVDKKRIYRTTNGGSAFLRLAEIDNATATYADTTADSALGAGLTTQYYTKLEPSSIFLTQNNRMYMAGDLSNPQRLYESALFTPEFLNTDESYYYDVDTQVSAIMRVSTGLIVAEPNALWLFSGTQLDNMTIQKLSGTQGCPCPTAVTYIDEGYPIWVSGDTIMAWDGSTIQDMGKYVSPRIRENIRAGTWDLSWPSLGYDPVSKLLYMSFA